MSWSSLDYRILHQHADSTLDKLEASIVVAQPENFGRPVKEILDQIIGLSDANDLTLVSIVSDGITVASQDNAPSSNDRPTLFKRVMRTRSARQRRWRPDPLK